MKFQPELECEDFIIIIVANLNILECKSIYCGFLGEQMLCKCSNLQQFIEFVAVLTDSFNNMDVILVVRTSSRRLSQVIKEYRGGE